MTDSPFLSVVADRKYAKKAVSLSSTMKSAMIGNEDFSMSDAMTSEHDLQYASKNFKFGLVPKVSWTVGICRFV